MAFATEILKFCVMKIIYNNIIPFKGFRALTFCKWIFARKEYGELPETTVNHEKIHIAQEDDFFIPVIKYLIFYIWYGLEWIFKLPASLFGYNAYYSISFEQETYEHQDDLEYLKNRKRFAWLKNIFKLRK